MTIRISKKERTSRIAHSRVDSKEPALTYDMTETPITELPPRILKQMDDVPSVPTVAIEILRLIEDKDATMDDFANVIQLDPALTVKLVRLANSSYFSQVSEITTLQRACSLVGLNTVRLMAVSFSLMDSLRASESGPFDYRQYWRRSSVLATAGRTWAKATGSSLADAAFVTGLVTHIGKLALSRGLARKYNRVIARSEGGWPSLGYEREVLGFSSREIGSTLLRSWKLPALIHRAVATEDDPDSPSSNEEPQTRELISIMRLAGYCEELICDPAKGSVIAELEQRAQADYGFSTSRTEEIILSLQAELGRTAEILAIETPSRVDVAGILKQAHQLLLTESLSVAAEIQEMKFQAKKLESRNIELSGKAYTDSLTGLANRAHFDQALGVQIEQRSGGVVSGSLGLLMIDVDHFKSFNDNYGHQVGDRVLAAVGQALIRATRQADLAARYGGDEFVVIIPGETPSGLEALAKRIRAAINALQVPIDGRSLSVEVSIGGCRAATVTSAQDVERLLRLADECLYQAKTKGGNRYELYPTIELPQVGGVLPADAIRSSR
ncbi:MAG: GGDEF domain-containing protein [Acidobacteria bacterium]|nr:GGDEF domain-containing protein [Acidobacteriota bacterium]